MQLLPQTLHQTNIDCTNCSKPLTLQVTTVLKADLPETDTEATFTLSASEVSCVLCGQKYPMPSTA